MNRLRIITKTRLLKSQSSPIQSRYLTQSNSQQSEKLMTIQKDPLSIRNIDVNAWTSEMLSTAIKKCPEDKSDQLNQIIREAVRNHGPAILHMYCRCK